MLFVPITKIEEAPFENAARGTRPRTILSALLLSAVALVSALLALEVVARRMTRPPPPEPRPMFAGHTPRNALGFRDFQYRWEKPAGHFRILVIGDSFTSAEGVSFDDSFPKRLERALNYRASNGTVFEVMNLGVARRSTPEEVALARKMIPRLSPDVLVLAYCLNDAEDWSDREGVMRLRATHAFEHFRRPEGLAGVLHDRSALVRLVLRRLYNARTRREHVRYYRDLYHPEYSGWRRTREAFADLGELSRETGVPTVVMVFPLYSWGLAESYPFRDVHARLEAVVRDAGLLHLDLLPAHYGFEPVRVEVLPGADAHPNEIGHRIAAEMLWKFLADENVLPAPQPLELAVAPPFERDPS